MQLVSPYLSGPQRLVLFVAGALALAAVYLPSQSGQLQMVVFGSLLCIAYPLARRRYGRVPSPAVRVEAAQLPRFYNPPLAALVEMGAVYLGWGAIVLALLPRDVFGPGLLGWLIAGPAGEVAALLLRRRVRRDGLRVFKRARPLRDIALMSAGLAVAMAAMTLLQGASASAALLAAGLGAGFMGLFGVGLVVYGYRRC